jgi:DNA-binding HxlR family transcriptional regulator
MSASSNKSNAFNKTKILKENYLQNASAFKDKYSTCILQVEYLLFYMKTKMPKSHCPINFALEIFGDKWTLLIIRDLLFYGKKYYGDFINSEEGISTNILADRLNLLERAGFVQKHDDEEHGSKYIYQPTPKAIDLIPMLLEMILWSAKHDPTTAAPKEFIARLKRDKTGVINEFLAATKKRKT